MTLGALRSACLRPAWIPTQQPHSSSNTKVSACIVRLRDIFYPLANEASLCSECIIVIVCRQSRRYYLFVDIIKLFFNFLILKKYFLTIRIYFLFFKNHFLILRKNTFSNIRTLILKAIYHSIYLSVYSAWSFMGTHVSRCSHTVNNSFNITYYVYSIIEKLNLNIRNLFYDIYKWVESDQAFLSFEIIGLLL